MRTKVRGQLPKFSIVAVTLNKRQGTGGDWLNLEKVQLPAREATLRQAQGDTRQAHEEQKTTKHPKHSANGTINVLLPNMEIRKVHLRLITRFNGMKVI